MSCPVCNGTGRVTHHERRGKKYVKVPNHPCFCAAGKQASQEDAARSDPKKNMGAWVCNRDQARPERDEKRLKEKKK